VRADANVGRVRQFGAASECETVDGGDDRHRQLIDPDEGCGVDEAQRVLGVTFPQLADVGARGERAARPRDDERAGLGLELGAQLVQSVDHALVDRVALRGAVQGRHHAIGASFDEEGAVTHTAPPELPTDRSGNQYAKWKPLAANRGAGVRLRA
jgi:hypothetical protein